MARKRQPNAEPSKAEQRQATMQAIRDGYQGDDIVSTLFQTAVNLEDEKRKLLERTAANRRSLRDLASQGLVSQEDVDAIYPPKAADSSTADEPVAA